MDFKTKSVKIKCEGIDPGQPTRRCQKTSGRALFNEGI